MEREAEVMGLPTNFGEESYLAHVAKNLEYGERLQRIVDPNNFIYKVSAEICDGDAFPVFFSNHNQHLNIAGMHKLIGALPFRPDDMYAVVAWSLLNDGQNAKIVSFAKALVPFLEKDSIHLVPLARPKDIADMRANGQKEQARFALHATRQNMELLENSLTKSAGLILFPGATTAEAVKDEFGVRPGMGKVEGNFMQDFAIKAKEVGRNVLWVPAGMVDTNRIVEPRESNPHLRAKFEIGKDKLFGHFGIDVITPIAQIVLGEPFYIENPSAFSGNEFNDYVMPKVAELLREKDRGYYGNNGQMFHELSAGRPRFLGIDY